MRLRFPLRTEPHARKVWHQEAVSTVNGPNGAIDERRVVSVRIHAPPGAMCEATCRPGGRRKLMGLFTTSSHTTR